MWKLGRKSFLHISAVAGVSLWVWACSGGGGSDLPPGGGSAGDNSGTGAKPGGTGGVHFRFDAGTGSTGAGGGGTVVPCESDPTKNCIYVVPDAGPYCGDGKVDTSLGEVCDDGNLMPGDGCSGVCAVEPNWDCPPTGGACTSNIKCGDGVRSPGEACDDGNTKAGDGCAANCLTTESGFYCPTPGEACKKLSDCGDGRMTTGENCDDGNKASGDGCDSGCRVETGYRCLVPKAACTKIPVCGDLIITPSAGENCEDGNTVSGDGCNAFCRKEADYYTCATVGQLCTSNIVCGDGKVQGTERCDDGNKTSGDGCSNVCGPESGWLCRQAGKPCIPNCGDGRVLGFETCDTIPNGANDGCSSTCQVEPGYTCTKPASGGSACTSSTCGNGVKEGVEQCDLGSSNGLYLGDGKGCSLTCTNEPLCRVAEADANGNYNRACTVICGDGVKTGTEDCDDGNARSGDGCSASCKTEGGFTCNDTTISPTKPCPSGSGSGSCLILPAIYRDFTATQYCSHSPEGVVEQPTPCATQFTNPHPDFFYWTNGINTGWGQGKTMLSQGLVQNYLNSSGKPAFLSGVDKMFLARGGNNWHITKDAASFAQWYTDTSRQTISSLAFAVAGNTATFSSDDPATPMKGDWGDGMEGHFPLDVTPVTEPRICQLWDDGWGYAGKLTTLGYNCNGKGPHDYNFTSEVRYVFQFKGGELLSFSGDDDVWVFINGRLAIDLGGMHQPRTGSVTLAAGNAPSAVQTQMGADDKTVYFVTAPYTPSSVTLGLTVGQSYEIVVYHADRHPIDSNYMLTLTGFNVTRSQCSPTCGDGVKTYNEQCDDGVNNGAYGTCSPGCVLAPFCGDGVKNGPEECDDGKNQDIAYGSARCAPGCKLPPGCGDGHLDPTEECDLGKAGNTGAYGGCAANCSIGPRCGDAITNGTEQCDDGVNMGGYGVCDAGCKNGPRCGDTLVQSAYGEQCDDGNTVDNDACSNTCGVRGRCGDGIVQSPVETCDDGTNDGSYGRCATDCTVGPRCGDGVVQKNKGEVCDSGAQNSDSINNYGGCTTRCKLGPHCGDGVISGKEQCDDGNTVSGDRCSSTCMKEISIPL